MPESERDQRYSEKLYNSSSENKCLAIQEIVAKTENKMWQISLANVLSVGDLISMDTTSHVSLLSEQNLFTGPLGKNLQILAKRIVMILTV